LEEILAFLNDLCSVKLAGTVFWLLRIIPPVGLHHPGVDGRIILKWISKNRDGGMDWFELAQDRGRWRALVNAVMNLRVP
jgi:hypothetical protein